MEHFSLLAVLGALAHVVHGHDHHGAVPEGKHVSAEPLVS